MVVRLNVHSEDNSGTEQVESVARVLPGRFSVLNLSPKVNSWSIYFCTQPHLS